MKVNFFLSALLAVLTLYACQTDNRENSENAAAEPVNTEQETPVKMIEQLVGEWELDGSQGGSNAGQGNTASQRLTFTEEARYIAHSGGQKVDSGAFRMNEQLRNLYFESEANEQPREYEVTLSEDVLTLKAKAGNQAGQGSQSLTYRRVGSGSISPEKRGEQ